jgi:hypothetical protein
MSRHRPCGRMAAEKTSNSISEGCLSTRCAPVARPSHFSRVPKASRIASDLGFSWWGERQARREGTKRPRPKRRRARARRGEEGEGKGEVSESTEHAERAGSFRAGTQAPTFARSSPVAVPVPFVRTCPDPGYRCPGRRLAQLRHLIASGRRPNSRDENGEGGSSPVSLPLGH